MTRLAPNSVATLGLGSRSSNGDIEGGVPLRKYLLCGLSLWREVIVLPGSGGVEMGIPLPDERSLEPGLPPGGAEHRFVAARLLLRVDAVLCVPSPGLDRRPVRALVPDLGEDDTTVDLPGHLLQHRDRLSPSRHQLLHRRIALLG